MAKKKNRSFFSVSSINFDYPTVKHCVFDAYAPAWWIQINQIARISCTPIKNFSLAFTSNNYSICQRVSVDFNDFYIFLIVLRFIIIIAVINLYHLPYCFCVCSTFSAHECSVIYRQQVSVRKLFIFSFR